MHPKPSTQKSSVQSMLSLQSTVLQSNTVVVVVVVVGVLVVDVVVVVLVVEVVVVTTTATRSSTQFSARAFTVGESVVLWQSFGFLASSFAKQPVYFATALSTQPFVFGSVGFPGVCASFRHLSRPATYFDAHFFLPAPHFVAVIGGALGSMAATSAATQVSTAVSAATVSSTVRQSFGPLLSSFSKQPLAGVLPPSNLVRTLVAQPLASGSAGLPGVSARASHLSNPVAFLAMQPVLPPRHFACWADAGAAGKSSSTVTSAVPIELLAMSPSDVQRSKRWKTARRMLQRGTTKPTIGRL